MSLAVSEDSSVDCYSKNIVKRVSFMRTLENFSVNDRFIHACGTYDFNLSRRCNPCYLCQTCRGKKFALENGYASNFEMDLGIKCSLIVHSNCLGSQFIDYVSLSLQFEELRYLKIMALCKFSILNVDGNEEYKSVVGVEKFDANRRSYYLQKFIDKKDLFQRQNILLPGGKLTVYFELFYFLSDGEYISGVSETTCNRGPLNMFLNDMSRMFISSVFCDCIIKVGGTEINVHKCILVSRSEVFRSKLENKSTKHESNVIEINDFCFDVVEEMVNYLYTGGSPRIDDMPFEMLEIAEMYKLEGLKLIATESLLRSLNVENVCEYLERSELYSAEILKEFCIRYIYFNGNKVIKNEKWNRIVNLYPLLVARIFNVAVNKC